MSTTTITAPWSRLIMASVARAVLGAAAGLSLWAVLPMIIGWIPTTVSTGSMQPRIMVGDVAVARPVPTAALRPGQVLLYDDPDHPGRLRLHRLVGIDDDGGLITRGDANRQDDSTPVAPSAVRGAAALRVPWVGLPTYWFRQGDYAPVVAVTLLAGLLTAATRLDRPLRVDDQRRPRAR